MASIKDSITGEGNDDGFVAFHTYLWDAVKNSPADSQLKKFMATVRRYTEGQIIGAAELKRLDKEASEIGERLNLKQRDLWARDQVLPDEEQCLMEGAKAAHHLFDEIRTRQDLGIPFSDALHDRVIKEAGSPVFRTVPGAEHAKNEALIAADHSDDRAFIINYVRLRKLAEEGPGHSPLKLCLELITDYVKGAEPDERQMANKAENARDMVSLYRKNGKAPTEPRDKALLEGSEAASFLFGEIERWRDDQSPVPPAIRRAVMGVAGMRHLQPVPKS